MGVRESPAWSTTPIREPLDDRDLVSAFDDRVEFANALVVHKIGLGAAVDVAYLEAGLRNVNPAATVIRAWRGRAPLTTALRDGIPAAS